LKGARGPGLPCYVTDTDQLAVLCFMDFLHEESKSNFWFKSNVHVIFWHMKKL